MPDRTFPYYWGRLPVHRLNLAAGSYDRAGNQLKVSPYTLTYDGESRMVEMSSAQNGSASYRYDGDGRRVKKIAGAVTTYFVYDAMGSLSAEYEQGGAVTQGGTKYVYADHLGSTRAIWDGTGVLSRRDHLPYGEEIPVDRNARSGESCAPGSPGCYGASLGVNQKFTGKEWDAETELDYFGARYFSGAQGRFTSPDAPFADQYAGDPQSWNLYAYVRNNPLHFIDPDGRGCTVSGNNYTDNSDSGPDCRTVLAGSGEAQKVTVGIGRDEANLVMLQGIGAGLSSPHQIATVASEGIQGGVLLNGLASLPSLGRSLLGLVRGPGLITLGNRRCG